MLFATKSILKLLVLYLFQDINLGFYACRYKKTINKSRTYEFEKIEIILIIFSDHNHMKLGINYMKENEKSQNVEIKQYSSEQSMGQTRNQKINK